MMIDARFDLVETLGKCVHLGRHRLSIHGYSPQVGSSNPEFHEPLGQLSRFVLKSLSVLEPPAELNACSRSVAFEHPFA